MGTQEKSEEQKIRQELVAYLRKLAKWKNNDVVKLAFLEPENVDRVDKLDLTGVVELKRNANGTFEAKFVDKVRVLAMLRELMEERRDGKLEDFLDGLSGPGDGDEA
ncbi:MAG: XRE family transcriptional regulator [Oscillospiraceae bacterium]|nr:XRE family transcriptional regulator [Oscillospiraceae bacterium]MDE7171812.1 XRE family transcriptional regulator [Oscillospiraceae bacterium]